MLCQTGTAGQLAAKRSGRSQSQLGRWRYVIGLAVAGLQGLKQIKCIGCRGNDSLEFSDAQQLRPNMIFDQPKLRVRSASPRLRPSASPGQPVRLLTIGVPRFLL